MMLGGSARKNFIHLTWLLSLVPNLADLWELIISRNVCGAKAARVKRNNRFYRWSHRVRIQIHHVDDFSKVGTRQSCQRVDDCVCSLFANYCFLEPELTAQGKKFSRCKE